MARCAVGIDIGGTFTKLALVDELGGILWHSKIPTQAHGRPDEYLARLCSLIEPLLASRPLGIGASVPGIFAPDCRSIVYNPNTPALVGVDFYDLLEAFHLPVRLEQDLNAPAAAEYAFGCGRGSRRFVAASLGTGAGTGVILDGQMLRFSGNFAGDTGHIILNPDGPPCTAGCRGCAEAMLAAPAVERAARQAFDDPRGAMLRAAAEGDHIPARAVIAAAQSGDPLAVEIMRGIGRQAGQWLASLAPIYLPDRFALCGGVAEVGLPLLEACRERFYQLCGSGYAQCTIELGTFRGLSGVIGAATPFLVDIEEQNPLDTDTRG